MPAAPRPSKKASKIAFNIIGLPPAFQGKETKIKNMSDVKITRQCCDVRR